jgi:hypothetical protein
MRKKLLIVVAVLLVLSLPAFAGFRLDIGIDVPFGLGVSGGANDFGNVIGNIGFIPIPELGIAYLWNLGPVDLGVGLRAYTVILESIAWPNAIVELKLDPVVIEAQVGGGLFAAFGLVGNSVAWGQVLIPDLSAWFKLGKTGAFRLGGGIMGIYAPGALGNYMPWLVYLGGKVALDL